MLEDGELPTLSFILINDVTIKCGITDDAVGNG